jgi:hypothetical protein
MELQILQISRGSRRMDSIRQEAIIDCPQLEVVHEVYIGKVPHVRSDTEIGSGLEWT